MKEMFRMVDKSKVDEVKQMLEYTQKGTAKATVGNYMVVLRNDPLVRESMKYNKLTGRIDIVKKLWWNEEVCKLDDDGRTYFYYFFERYYKLTSEKCMDKALRIEANSRAYHPICEYLEQLEWDGQERIRYVLQRYMGADASDFVYEVVKHFLMEAENLGVEIKDEYIRPANYVETVDTAIQTKELMSLTEKPTCIVYPDDTSLIGGLNTLMEMGYRIPEDISVAGYDGTHVSQLMYPKITTIRQDTERIGREAAERLIRLIEKPKTTLNERVVIDGILLPGQSVGEAKKD